MKFIVSIVLTALLSFTAGLFANILPWYSFVFCAFVVAIVIHQKPLWAFLSGFAALFLLWGILASVIDEKNQHILSAKVANILPLSGSYILLILVTAFVGGLLAGFAALAGCYVRKK